MTEIQNMKWCAIQPLTGGMYLGAEKVMDHPAEFILSYPGLADPKIDKKTGEISSVSNEYHLMKYLNKVGRRPEYKVFDRAMFQNDTDLNPTILNSDLWTINKDKDLDFSDMHLVVAVPVCSGLSTVTSCSQDTKDTRNCNMVWISRYVLNVIKPNIYIFENAPTFMSKSGERVRVQLETIAKDNNYSICYYRTDTKYHDNCQRRKRTFVIFYKKDYAPKMEFEHLEVTWQEYLNRIPKDATQNEPLKFEYINWLNKYFVEFIKFEQGDNWRAKINYDAYKYIVNGDKWDNVRDYVRSREDISDEIKEKCYKALEFMKSKVAAGKGFWHKMPGIIKETDNVPAIMFSTIQGCLHPIEDRLFTPRECLHFMGMPHDFELQGNPNKMYPQIGQNVPVRTAYWIVSEALRAYERDNDLEEKNTVRFFDNIKQEEIKYDHLV